MVAVRQKPLDQLVNRRGGRGRRLEVILPAKRRVPHIPAPPAGQEWSRRVVGFWREFWHSRVSAAVDMQADGERLYRWLEAIQERETLLGDVRRDGYAPARKVIAESETSEGRVIVLLAGAHPHLAYIKHLDREIARMAEHFGMSPLSRFRLQFTYATAEEAGDRLRARRGRRSDLNALEVVNLDAT